MANLQTTLSILNNTNIIIGKNEDGSDKMQAVSLAYICAPSTTIASLPLIDVFAQTKREDTRNVYQLIRDLNAMGMIDKCSNLACEKMVYIGRALENSNCIDHVAIGGDATLLIVFMLNSYTKRKGNVYSKSDVVIDLNAVHGKYTPTALTIPVSSGGNRHKSERAAISPNKALMESLGIELE